MGWNDTWTGEIEGIAAGSNGTVYAGTTRGMVRSYDPSGDERWTYDTGADVESVASTGGAVYAGCVDGSLHRIDAGSGEGDWTVDAHSDEIVSVATDATGGDAVYSGDGAGEIRCHDADGSHRWTYTGHGNDVEGLYARDGYVYAGDDTQTASKLTADGDEVWFRDVSDDVEGASAGPSGQVYLNGDGGQAVTGYSADGDRRWRYTDHSRSLEAMAFAVAPDGTEVVWSGDNGGSVSELDGDGNDRWFDDPADDQIDAMDADDDGNLYLGAGDTVYKVTERAWGDSGGDETADDEESNDGDGESEADVEARLQELGVDPELTTAELVTLARDASGGQ